MFGPVFCISILEIRGTQIISHSLDFNAFYIIQHYFCQFFLNFLKLRRGDLISLEGPIQQGGRIIWSSSLLYFNFRNLRNPNSSSLIGFPCILHDSAVLFSVFGDFLGVGGGGLVSCGEEQFCGMAGLFGSPFCVSILVTRQ